MRKLFIGLLVLALAVTLLIPLGAISAQSQVTVVVNGQVQNYEQPPIIENGRSLVPLRGIFETLGADVSWNADTKTVLATSGKTTIQLTIGQHRAFKNGSPLALDVPASIKNGRTMVPLRFVSETLGANVQWDGNTKTVIITTGNFANPGEPENLKVHFIDVGQGDATYISLPNNVDILIDAGNNWYGDDVVAYLNSQDVDDIEYLISTHPDADHIGGLDVVLNSFIVENVYAPNVSHTTQSYEDFLTAVLNEGLKINEAKAGKKITDIATCSAIGCPPSYSVGFVGPVKDYGDDLNSWSAVLRLNYGDTSFLFTGDATTKSESDMMVSGQKLQANVLKIGHHGSDTSTSQAFLNAVKPDYGVISVGADNSYGHPTQEVLQRLSTNGVDVYRTDESGSIVATSDGTSITYNSDPSDFETPIDSPTATGNVVITDLDLSAEKVTIKNNGALDVLLAGWELISEEGNQTFVFPDNFTLKAGTSVTIWAGSNTVDNPPTDLKWTGSYIWNNDGDIAALYDAGGNLMDRVVR